MRKTMTTVAVLAATLAAAPLLHSQAGLAFHGPLARVLTPNGDGRNDLAFFCFDNPSDSDISGKVYSLLGSEVATLSPRSSSSGTSCPGSALIRQFVTWDGRSRGRAVTSGLYVYRITAEGRVFAGTLLVVR